MRGLTGITLVMQSNIGDLTNKRLDALGKAMGWKYPKLQNYTSNSLNIFTKDDKNFISVNNNIISICYNDLQTLDEIATNEILEDLKLFIDTMLIDEQLSNFAIRFINVVEMRFNTMEALKASSGIFGGDFDTDVVGMGYRYLLKNDTIGYDDIRIEPLLNDVNFLFIEGVFNCGNVNYNNLKDLILNKYSKFQSFCENADNKLLNM